MKRLSLTETSLIMLAMILVFMPARTARPADDNIPDLDEVINTELSGAKDDMAALEKVIEEEEAKAEPARDFTSSKDDRDAEPKTIKRSRQGVKEEVEVIKDNSGRAATGGDEPALSDSEALGLPSDNELPNAAAQ